MVENKNFLSGGAIAVLAVIAVVLLISNMSGPSPSTHNYPPPTADLAPHPKSSLDTRPEQQREFERIVDVWQNVSPCSGVTVGDVISSRLNCEAT
jgi:hypothetical protein